MKGWVYVITNEAFPGCVKIGYTEDHPNSRAKGMQTGAPTIYEVQYEVRVDYPKDIETALKLILEEYKVSGEWYRCSVEKVVHALKEIPDIAIHKVENTENGRYIYEDSAIPKTKVLPLEVIRVGKNRVILTKNIASIVLTNRQAASLKIVKDKLLSEGVPLITSISPPNWERVFFSMLETLPIESRENLFVDEWEKPILLWLNKCEKEYKEGKRIALYFTLDELAKDALNIRNISLSERQRIAPILKILGYVKATWRPLVNGARPHVWHKNGYDPRVDYRPLK